MRTYKGKITALNPNQIFVFGSNTEGRHGRGAARWAHRYAGAVYGVAYGPMGRSYAICTKDLNARLQPSIPPDQIVSQIRALYLYALARPKLDFLVAYSGTGVNLNGYTPTEMAHMFSEAGEHGYPENVIFEERFSKLLY